MNCGAWDQTKNSDMGANLDRGANHFLEVL